MKTIISIVKTKQKYHDHQYYPGIYCKCPACKDGDVVYGSVSCPDEREGCCVAHWGYGCKDCKAVFNAEFEKDGTEVPFKDLKFTEEIGIAIINPRGLKNLIISKDKK